MEREARETRERASNARKARAVRAARRARAGARRQGAAARREWREPPEDGDSKPVRSRMALARPLRGLRRAFEVGERLGHLFPVPASRETYENQQKIYAQDLPEVSRELLGLTFGLLGLIWALLKLILAVPVFTLELLGRSWRSREPLGKPKMARKSLPEGLPEASRSGA